MPASTTAAPTRFDLIGVGSPIMDLLALVPDEFLAQHVAGAKGGMELVDALEVERLVSHLATAPAVGPGGSAANATHAAARLGLSAAFLGKLGDDPTARAYEAAFRTAGVDGSRFKRAALPNARCLSLVTPDSERTMRTCLAAAMTLDPAEITPADFAGCRHAHMEGYLLFNQSLAEAVIAAARAAGCPLSLDLPSFEVVGAMRDWILAQLERGIDVVFANADEIRALFGASEDYAAHARRLAGYGTIAGVKLGKDGAWVARGDELHRIEPVVVDRVIDTTGAGDAWAAGFLYGHLRGLPLPVSGAIASLLGAETVRHLSAVVPESEWPSLLARVRALGA